MKVSMFNWFEGGPNINGLMKHKITAITPHQLEESLASFYRQADKCGEKIVRMKMVLRSSLDVRSDYAIIWTERRA